MYLVCYPISYPNSEVQFTANVSISDNAQLPESLEIKSPTNIHEETSIVETPFKAQCRRFSKMHSAEVSKVDERN